MSKKTIYFVRHGETDFNRMGIVQGSGVDSDLNETGRQQANAFYQSYQDLPLDLIITSSLKRTYQTIQPFLASRIPMLKDARINEINWGDHEGKKSEPWMIKAYQEMIAEWGRDNFSARLSNGESAAELADRLQRFLDDLVQRSENHILVCTHGRTLRCMMCLVKGQHLREMESYRHSNTGLFKVQWAAGQFEVELENDTRHLALIQPEK